MGAKNPPQSPILTETDDGRVRSDNKPENTKPILQNPKQTQEKPKPKAGRSKVKVTDVKTKTKPKTSNKKSEDNRQRKLSDLLTFWNKQKPVENIEVTETKPSDRKPEKPEKPVVNEIVTDEEENKTQTQNLPPVTDQESTKPVVEAPVKTLDKTNVEVKFEVKVTEPQKPVRVTETQKVTRVVSGRKMSAKVTEIRNKLKTRVTENHQPWQPTNHDTTPNKTASSKRKAVAELVSDRKPVKQRVAEKEGLMADRSDRKLKKDSASLTGFQYRNNFLNYVNSSNFGREGQGQKEGQAPGRLAATLDGGEHVQSGAACITPVQLMGGPRNTTFDATAATTGPAEVECGNSQAYSQGQLCTVGKTSFIRCNSASGQI